MMKVLLFISSIFLVGTAAAQKLSYKENAQRYIEQYRQLAMEEQQRVGIPAAITLGQGILETQAGQSELVTQAHNHFGIKCKKDWTGDSFLHTDDAPNECFRKYPNDLASYRDHSEYLKTSKRYLPCFECAPNDYQSWAKALRRCGYATSPTYAAQLIKIIEDFQLQQYTIAANTSPRPIFVASLDSPVAAAAMIEQTRAREIIPEKDAPIPATQDAPEYGKLVKRNGIRGFYAHKNDVLLEYAIQYKMRYAKLLEINKLPDAPLAADQFIAIERGGNSINNVLSRDVSEPEATPVAVSATANAHPVIAAAAAEKV
ncbi:MAG: glucosaminidase domain-containing protein, partial [Chitinophagaceae bacterium]